MVLIWPRFLVLIAYVTMLFLYVLLARWEEERCLEKYGESYRVYLERTGRFMPRGLTRWLPTLPSVRPALLPWVWLAAVALSVAGGWTLREVSLARITASWDPDTAILSPALISHAELAGAYELAAGVPWLEAARDAAGDEAWIVYVVPESWYLADLPLHGWTELSPDHRRGHVTPRDFDRRRYKVLFTRALTHRPQARGVEILRAAYGREPLWRVHVDLARKEVTAIEKPPAHVVWGDIPTPLF